ncbi:hypothetical protein P3X46_031121 [Hevea brasiliensis]|uniref:Uncharacterized protein n=1 Tax=Hevea brasiliensis TaxID=3981 RepID=A0ABQ9KMF4_HEVBR|nr:transcription factor MYB28 [Hevea brasiliensis]KAJ9140475.1 hypothetical protein P3X46_031121 [Hevea brasiliensis]
MGRTPGCNTDGLKKGAWTADEDQKLIAYIQEHGEGGWRTLPQKAGLQRCGKSCRLRWANYLRPDIKRGEFSTEEEQKIIQLHASLGNRWSAIARNLPKRTDNEIKNYWNTHLKKRQAEEGTALVSRKPFGPSSAPPDAIHESSECEPAQPQPTSLRPASASAQLLNKIAAKLAPSTCLETLKTSQSLQTLSTEADKEVVDVHIISNTCQSEPPPSLAVRSPDMPRPVSTSARILNKMAGRLTTHLHCLDTLKSILSGSSDNHNFMHRSPSASSLSETASDMSRSISTSNGGINDQMPTHNHLSPLIDSFDLDLLEDWNGVSDCGVSSSSLGDTYNGWESPVSPLNNNNNNNNNALTFSGCESMGTCSGEVKDAMTTETTYESEMTFGYQDASDQYAQYFTDGFSNFFIGDSHVVSACSGDSHEGKVFEEDTYSWNNGHLFENYQPLDSHIF